MGLTTTLRLCLIASCLTGCAMLQPSGSQSDLCAVKPFPLTGTQREMEIWGLRFDAAQQKHCT